MSLEVSYGIYEEANKWGWISAASHWVKEHLEIYKTRTRYYSKTPRVQDAYWVILKMEGVICNTAKSDYLEGKRVTYGQLMERLCFPGFFSENNRLVLGYIRVPPKCSYVCFSYVDYNMSTIPFDKPFVSKDKRTTSIEEGAKFIVDSCGLNLIGSRGTRILHNKAENCSICGEYGEGHHYFIYNPNYILHDECICSECYETLIKGSRCSCCGLHFPEGMEAVHVPTLTYIPRHKRKPTNLCVQCADTLTFECKECNKHFFSAYSAAYDFNSNGYLCHDCRNDNYYCCWCEVCNEKSNGGGMVKKASHFCPDKIKSFRFLSSDDDGYSRTLGYRTPYGVEIECYAERGCDVSDISDFVIDTTDASLRNDGAYERALEACIGPVSGNKGLDVILEVVRKLHRYDARVDRTCGLHVHVDAKSLSANHVKNIVRFVARHEGIIYSMLPSSRKSEGFSVPSSTTMDVDFLKKEKNLLLLEQAQENRYSGLNLQPMPSYGSIEFRYHSGTLTFEKIHNWILICLAIINEGKDYNPQTPYRCEECGMEYYIVPHTCNYCEHDTDAKGFNAKTFKSFVNTLNLPEFLVKYIKRRIVKFGVDESKIPSFSIRNLINRLVGSPT